VHDVVHAFQKSPKITNFIKVSVLHFEEQNIYKIYVLENSLSVLLCMCMCILHMSFQLTDSL